jgi:hypothetical protein
MKRMAMVSILVVLLAACSGPMVSGDAIRGSSQLVSRTFDLDGFTQIEANNAAQVTVTRGEPFHVEVEINENLESRLDVKVTGSTLHIRLQNGSYTNVKFRAQVTMPELTGITLNGASTIKGSLAGEDLALDLNGASWATLTGTAGDVTAVVNGASQGRLADLVAGNVTVDVNGASRLEIQATGTVRGAANGASTVVVNGSPTSVDVEAEGASRVTTR